MAEDMMEVVERLGTEYAQRVHRVFAQSEEGRQLLDQWTEQSLIMEWESDSIYDIPDLDPQRLAYKEGQRWFMKHIHALIKYVEEK